jgi:adenylate kinase
MPSEKSLVPAFHDKFKAVLLFGPPGSGKGTLGKFLGIAGNHWHLSSGDIFRGLDPESTAGKLYHTYANKGHLVPDEVTIEIWHRYVEGLIATNRYFPRHQLLLLDGIPRTVKQAEILDRHIEVVQIIILETENMAELERRLLRRGTIEKRADDKDLEILKTRMRVYEKETVQLLSHYPSSLIARFNADQRPLEVLRDVLVKLASKLK